MCQSNWNENLTSATLPPFECFKEEPEHCTTRIILIPDTSVLVQTRLKNHLPSGDGSQLYLLYTIESLLENFYYYTADIPRYLKEWEDSFNGEDKCSRKYKGSCLNTCRTLLSDGGYNLLHFIKNQSYWEGILLLYTPSFFENRSVRLAITKPANTCTRTKPKGKISYQSNFIDTITEE